MDFFITTAWAQAASGSTAGTLGTILPLVLIFVVFYFLLIRPQTKRAKEHREMVAKLATGDEVVTNGGILGRITEVGESFVTLQVSGGVAIQVQKIQIAQLMPKGRFTGACAPATVARAALSPLEGHLGRGRHGRGDPGRAPELVRRIACTAAFAPRSRGRRRHRSRADRSRTAGSRHCARGAVRRR
jgi:preprotein translocase subunit YajC